MDRNFSQKAWSCHILVKQERTFPINIAELCLWHLCLSNWFKICESSELESWGGLTHSCKHLASAAWRWRAVSCALSAPSSAECRHLLKDLKKSKRVMWVCENYDKFWGALGPHATGPHQSTGPGVTAPVAPPKSMFKRLWIVDLDCLWYLYMTFFPKNAVGYIFWQYVDTAMVNGWYS